MNEQPTERQVLYALVAGGFLLVVAVLAVGSASAGLVPAWWSVTVTACWLAAAVAVALRWRSTPAALGISIGLFIAWTVGTLVVA